MYQVLVYRNVAGEIYHADFLQWKNKVKKTVNIKEINKQQFIVVELTHDQQVVSFYLKPRDPNKYLVQLDYLRIEGKLQDLVEACETLFDSAKASGEKYVTSEGKTVRTIFSPTHSNSQQIQKYDQWRKTESFTFDLSLHRETLLGQINITLDRLIESRKANDREAEYHCLKILRELGKKLEMLSESQE